MSFRWALLTCCVLCQQHFLLVPKADGRASCVCFSRMFARRVVGSRSHSWDSGYSSPVFVKCSPGVVMTHQRRLSISNKFTRVFAKDSKRILSNYFSLCV